MEYSLPYGSERLWSPGVPDIVDHPVRVVGLAAVGVPVLGPSYIVELLRPVPGYEYTHAVAFAVNLR